MADRVPSAAARGTGSDTALDDAAVRSTPSARAIQMRACRPRPLADRVRRDQRRSCPRTPAAGRRHSRRATASGPSACHRLHRREPFALRHALGHLVPVERRPRDRGRGVSGAVPPRRCRPPRRRRPTGGAGRSLRNPHRPLTTAAWSAGVKAPTANRGKTRSFSAGRFSPWNASGTSQSRPDVAPSGTGTRMLASSATAPSWVTSTRTSHPPSPGSVVTTAWRPVGASTTSASGRSALATTAALPFGMRTETRTGGSPPGG